LYQPFINFVQVENMLAGKLPHAIAFDELAQTYGTFDLSVEPRRINWLAALRSGWIVVIGWLYRSLLDSAAM
jgi:hypothetical protein